MKKLVSIILALAMIMMVGAAFAETITITNAKAGESYSAYKIIDATVNGSNVAYFIKTTSPWFTLVTGEAANTTEDTFTNRSLTFTRDNTDTTKFIITVPTNSSGASTLDEEWAKTLSADVKTALDNATVTDTAAATISSAAGDGTDALTVSGAGYYFVDTSLGTVCAIATAKDVAVTEKSSIPSGDKKESATAGTVGSAMTYTETSLTANIGDTIYYEIAVTDGKGTDNAITVHDKMSSGLILNANSIKVYKNAVEVDAGASTFSINTAPTDEDTFDVVFTAAYVAGLAEDDVVIIRYNARLTEAAIIHGGTGSNNNTMHIEYSEQNTQDVTVTVDTFKLQIVKDDSDKNLLTGAKFKIYGSANGTDEIKVVACTDEDADYIVTTDAAEGVKIDAGTPIIKGLKTGTYWLEETDAPTGYNKITTRQQFTVGTGNNLATFTQGETPTYSSGGVEVVNNAGVQLPSTGGIGTTIFYILGGILVIGAAVILIARRKAHD